MSGKHEAEQERQALQELKGQLGDCNVAPPDSLGFGRRFAEIISRLGNVKSVARQKKQKFKQLRRVCPRRPPQWAFLALFAGFIATMTWSDFFASRPLAPFRTS